MSDESNNLTDESLAGIAKEVRVEEGQPGVAPMGEAELGSGSIDSGQLGSGQLGSGALSSDSGASDEKQAFQQEPGSQESGGQEGTTDSPAELPESPGISGSLEESGEAESEDIAVNPEPAVQASQPLQASPDPVDDPGKKDWYILKVQSNRERSIAEALRRKIAIEGLEEYFGDVVVPTEKVTEFKGGKKKVVERKLYPGYIVVCMCINDDTWFAVRETSGIGDFTGSGGKPTPMLPHEVARIIQKDEEEQGESPKLDIRFKLEDRVKIKEGTFEGFEGDVSSIDEASGRVTVMINIFSRSTPVELEYWQIESV